MTADVTSLCLLERVQVDVDTTYISEVSVSDLLYMLMKDELSITSKKNVSAKTPRTFLSYDSEGKKMLRRKRNMQMK